MNIHFRDLQAPAPSVAVVGQQYQHFHAALDKAQTAEDWLQVIGEWDRYVRQLMTWENLTDLRFQQNTRDAAAKQQRDFLDEIRPKLTDFAMQMKRRILASPYRAALQQRFGDQAFALWECDLKTFQPEIEAHLVQEAKLGSEYTELLASASIEFRGQTYNLSGLAKFREDADRGTRKAANEAYWGWFAQQRPLLDRIFDDLVKQRDEMARKLGFRNFIGLGYQRMKRVDYSEADVDQYRAEVRQYVVPLASEIRQQQAAKLGLDRLMYWDEPVHDLAGNPAPQGDHDWMLEKAQHMFDALGPELGDFFRLMVRADLMDLKNRDGKAGGGFCTDFPAHGIPYIFANFNGTKGDVEVFTHEIGHAFQSYLSREQPLADYLFPTYESCEIHSMSLEFLTWPHMDKFFGEDAERFRKIHLSQSLLFLPYGVAVDHFQHLIYQRPEASPAERHAMWQEMERTYLPWRDFGDLPHLPEGAFWQFQRHIYLMPFYYIDYTLAQTCALQFWARSNQDFAAAMKAYVTLCRRGGEAPFQDLASSAGLISPFRPGCLKDVVAQARTHLGL